MEKKKPARSGSSAKRHSHPKKRNILQNMTKNAATEPATLCEADTKAPTKKGKNKFKAPRSISIPITSDTLIYNSSFFTIGDIVSVMSNGIEYYAQIRGLLMDQYCEKSAVLTWLLPTTSSPKGRFDPNTFILGHEEELPRELDGIEFVCHAPSEYFKCSNPINNQLPEYPTLGFARTTKGYVIVQLPAEEFSTDDE